MMLYFILSLVLVLVLLHYIWSCSPLRKLSGPKGRFLIGNSLDVLGPPDEQFRKFREYAKTYDRIFILWLFYETVVNIYNPADIEMLIGSSKHGKKGLVYRYFKSWLQDGLLISSGPKWQHRRKILTPAFHYDILRLFCTKLSKKSKRLADKLENEKGPSDVLSVMSEFSLDSICETAMGFQLDADKSGAGERYKDALEELGYLIFKRASNLLLTFEFPYKITALARKTTDLIKTIHSFSKNVINKRKKEMLDKKLDRNYGNTGLKKKGIALLDLLLSAEEKGIIDNTGIQEEVDTFMFEGYDTTARGLTYSLMLIANHKHIQDKIYVELEKVYGDLNESISLDDLSKLRYLECCIKESLRLYPPVPLITRTTTEEVQLSNCTVPAGTDVHVHIYDLHRCEDLYEDALVFNPDRFSPANNVGRHHFAYLPFSAGPRNCIGQKFAMMEMKLCLAEILRRFEVEPITRPEEIIFVMDFILRSANPILVKFKPRNLKH